MARHQTGQVQDELENAEHGRAQDRHEKAAQAQLLSADMARRVGTVASHVGAVASGWGSRLWGHGRKRPARASRAIVPGYRSVHDVLDAGTRCCRVDCDGLLDRPHGAMTLRSQKGRRRRRISAALPQGVLALDAGAIAAKGADANSGGADAVFGGATVEGGALTATDAGGSEGSDAGPVGKAELAGMATAVAGALTGVSFEHAARARTAAAVQPYRRGFIDAPPKHSTLLLPGRHGASADRILPSAGTYAEWRRVASVSGRRPPAPHPQAVRSTISTRPPPISERASVISPPWLATRSLTTADAPYRK